MKQWQFSPAVLPPLGSKVHVWIVELDSAAFDSIVRQNPLSIAERERAAKFKFDKDRRRFIVAHAALRHILALYLKGDAAHLHFVDGPNGKPKLAAPWDARGIRFNLSHSHEKAVVAVAQGAEVGVDIEFVRADFAFHEVANHFFTEREVAALRALPPELQRHAFYKCWTSKEALLKAKGTGLSGALDEIEISLSEERHVQIGALVSGWSLLELAAGDDYEAALVIQERAEEVLCYRWQGPW
jgi:4'-phosphopantetheinyl transferase